MKLSGVTSVLVVTSDQEVHTKVEKVLRAIGVENVALATSCQEALDATGRENFNLAIIDQRINRQSGLHLVLDIRSKKEASAASLPILVLVGAMRQEEIILLRELDTVLAVTKHFEDQLLAGKIFEILSLGDVSTNHSALDTVDYNQFARVVSDAILNKQLDMAEEFIDRRLVSDEKSPRLNVLLAKLRLAQRRLGDAKAIVERILRSNADFLLALNLKAKIAVLQGDFREALAVMEYSQSLSPLNTQRLLAMAEINLGFGRLSSATTQFGRALEIYPELERAKVGLARCHAEAGRHEKAQAIVRTMTDQFAVVSELNLKGVMLAKAGYFKEAVSLYKKALACSGDLRLDTVIYYNMALSYFKEKDSSSAEKAVKRSVAADPEFRKAANLKRRIEKRVFFTDEELGNMSRQPPGSSSNASGGTGSGASGGGGDCLLTETQVRFLTGTFNPALAKG